MEETAKPDVVTLRMPRELGREIRELAKEGRRPLNEELLIAIERYVTEHRKATVGVN